MPGKEMSFLEHIGELRGHLVRIVIAIIIGAVIIGFNVNYIMDEVLFAPTKNDFITFKILNYLSEHLGTDTRIEMPEKFPIQVRKMYEQVNVAISVSVIGGIILVFPYIVYEVWKFIAPGLTDSERKKSVFFIIGTSIFFLLGVLIGFYLVAPLSVQFGYNFKISDIAQTNIDLANYIDIIINTCLGMGIVFLLPVVVYFLTASGIITPSFLTTYRKHAIIVVLVISAFITPPDATTMVIASLPLIALYEFSIMISKITYKRQE
ncbi:MAG: twin-arginine translocase subunit TatC [Flavobacteriales bacterium]|nr:twin-arginine translocase subunit TatC [Flavobacteriales bacterium]